MTASARAMAEGYVIVGGCQVTALRRDDTGWSVHTVDGPVDTSGNGRFSAVILAVPAPQAVPLAASAGAARPGLETVRYAPCWALMHAFSTFFESCEKINFGSRDGGVNVLVLLMDW